MGQGETEHQLGTETAPTGRLLFALLGGAAAWSLHFLAGYAALAIGCVAGWSGIRAGQAIGTLALLVVALNTAVDLGALALDPRPRHREVVL